MKNKLIILLAVISALLFAEQVNAATIEVCKSGCDYSSIKTAYENSNAGDTIRIKEGTYEEDTIKIDKKINIIGETRDGIIIKQKAEDDIFYIDGTKDTITLNNLVIDSVMKGEGKKPIYINESEDIVLTNITIKDSDVGITITSSSNIRIHNLIATNILKNAILATKSKVEITGGTIANAGNILEDNTQFPSIALYDESEGKIINTIIKDTESNAISVKKSKVEITGGEIINAGGFIRDSIDISSISLSSETEGTISGVKILDGQSIGLEVSHNTKPIIIKDIIVTNMKENGINIQEKSSNVKLLNVFIDNTRNGLKVKNSTIQAEDIYIVNSKEYAINLVDNGKITLKNINELKNENYKFLGYSEEEICDDYIDNSDYTNDGDISLYSCVKNLSEDAKENTKENAKENTKENIDNPKTGDFSIFLIVSLTILAIGGTIYYFKRIRNNKKINFK